MRERQGLALALDYLSRVYFRDPSDDVFIMTSSRMSTSESVPKSGSSSLSRYRQNARL